MTVAAKSSSKSYNGNGVTVNFAAPFRYIDPSHLEVTLVAAGGAVTTLAYPSGFTATPGTTDDGGTVTCLVAPASGTIVRIKRATPRSQGSDYTTGDTFPAETHEQALDRAMLIDQEQDQKIDDTASRAILFPDGETGAELASAALRAKTVLGFDAGGGLELKTPQEIVDDAATVITVASAGSIASSRAVVRGIVGPVDGQGVWLTEAGRAGLFVFSSANHATRVTNDPLEGVTIAPTAAPTGASGAWLRVGDELTPEMWGISGTDNLTALRNAGYWACQLKLPLRAGAGPYWLTGYWRVGSRTGAAPAAGVADKLAMPGAWRFICDAPAGDAFVGFENGILGGARVGDMDFDIVTGVPIDGHGQCRLVDYGDFSGGRMTKIGTQAMAATYLSSGGSVFSVNGKCERVFAQAAIVEWAGTVASASFSSFTAAGNPKGLAIVTQRCVGGQDTCDISGTDGFWFGEIEGFTLTDTDSSIFDCGNSSNGHVDKIRGNTVTHAMTLKTESSGGTHLGCNGVTVGAIDVDQWTKALLLMSAGATVTQTLHDLRIGSIVGKTTVAVGTTRAIITAAGDVAGDPTRGLFIGHGRVTMNAGVAIEHQNGLIEYAIRDFRCNAPEAMLDNTPSGFAPDAEGLFENCRFTGNFTAGFGVRGSIFRNCRIGGAIAIGEGRRNRYHHVEAKSWDLTWNTGGADEKDVVLDHCRSTNAAARALWVRCLGAPGVIHGVKVHHFEALDTQGVPTSTGYAFENATFDFCELRDSTTRGVASTLHTAFAGASSRNYDNNI